MKVRICVHCGREYVSDKIHSNVCSEKCRRERALQRNREYKRTHVLLVRCTICGKRIAGRRIYCDECKATHAKTADPALAYAPVSLNIIRRAKKQPRGVSDTRWRMELSRRKLERECLDAYHLLPDPDRLG